MRAQNELAMKSWPKKLFVHHNALISQQASQCVVRLATRLNIWLHPVMVQIQRPGGDRI